MRRRWRPRVLYPGFIGRSIGFGPEAGLAEKTWRAIRLAGWYLPGLVRLRRIFDQADEPSPAAFGSYDTSDPTQPIDKREIVLVDQSRNIRLDCTVTMPSEINGPMPVVLYSVPATMGRRHKAPKPNFLTDHLARAGYVTVSMAHTGSDKKLYPLDFDDVPDGYTYTHERAHDPALVRDQFLDNSFLIDSLEVWNRDGGAFAGLLDLDRVGLSGHSYGAVTVLASLGAKTWTDGISYKDSRIKAGISNAPVPTVDPYFPSENFDEITVPVLHLAGAYDTTWTAPTLPVDAVRAFEKIHAPDQYKLVLRGADHNTMSGGREEAGIASHRERTNLLWCRTVSLAFWDAYLRDDPAAKKWLREELPAVLGRDGTFERK